MFRVLIVDDEPFVRESLRANLPWESIRCVVESAGSAAEALEKLARRQPDVLLTDIRMPGMDGLDLTARVRERYPDLPVVLLTGHADFEYARRALTLGAFGYCLKPFEEETVFPLVRQACEQRAAVRARPKETWDEGWTELLKEQGPPTPERPIHLAVVTSPNDLLPPGDWESVSIRLDKVCRCVLAWNQPTAQWRRWTEGLTGQGAWGWAAREHLAGPIAFDEVLGLREQAYSWFFQRNAENRERPSPLPEPWKATVAELAKELPSGEIGKALDLVARLQSEFASGSSGMGDLCAALDTVHRVVDALLPGDPAGPFQPDGLVLRFPSARAALESLRDRIEGNRGQLSGRALVSAGTGGSSRIVSFLISNYQRSLSLSEVAQACALSETYASAAFRKETGQSITEFLNQLRVEQASRLLLETSYGLEEIAQRVGFSSYFYFCRVFKNRTGVAPGSFRKNRGGLQPRPR